MKGLIVVFLCCSLSVSLVAQEFPIDFSDENDTFLGFEGSGFSKRSDPNDGANSVGQFFNDGSIATQGFFIDLAQEVDLSQENILTLSFYSFDPNTHTIKLKLENGGADPDIEIDRTTQAMSGWQRDISFDFEETTGTYSRLTVFIDFGTTQPGTYLLDDINNGSETQNPDPDAPDVVYDVLVWSDEFDSGSTQEVIDNSKWFHQTQLPAGGSWFNGEQQHYTNRIENSYIQNGFLHIKAKKESFTDQGETKNYTSARLNSKFAFTYGRVDVRAKLPQGAGTWPAIWTLGKNINEAGAYWQTQGFGTVTWPACGELDIMEHGLGAVNHTSSAIHTPSSFGNTVNTASQEITDVANTFHIYSMNWSPNKITFLVDNIAFYTYEPTQQNSSTWPFDLDQYLLLNIAMGGVAGTIDPNFTESDMVIDYVRVYQSEGILSVETFDVLDVKVFPNPSKGFINVKSDNLIDKVELYDVLGKKVIENKVNNFTNRLPTDNLSQGIYFLELYLRNKKLRKKIMIY